ncbi:MAG: FAD-dependent oxidoreductase, partial [Sphingomicrobium sp.]
MQKVDVLIVGGGIAGASLGARLAGSMRVILIEAEDICGRHSTGRSAAFWEASLGGATPERRLSLASKPMFDAGWPGSSTPVLKRRGTLHLCGPHGDRLEGAEGLTGEHAVTYLDRMDLDRRVPGLRSQWTGAWYE